MLNLINKKKGNDNAKPQTIRKGMNGESTVLRETYVWHWSANT